jgi:hypothetical protein
MTPDELLPKIKLQGELSRTLVLTRHKGQAIVMICEDYLENAFDNTGAGTQSSE